MHSTELRISTAFLGERERESKHEADKCAEKNDSCRLRLQLVA